MIRNKQPALPSNPERKGAPDRGPGLGSERRAREFIVADGYDRIPPHLARQQLAQFLISEHWDGNIWTFGGFMRTKESAVISPSSVSHLNS
jgi:hypothetical protein